MGPSCLIPDQSYRKSAHEEEEEHETPNSCFEDCVVNALNFLGGRLLAAIFRQKI